MIEHYLAELRRGLRGPLLLRRSMLREVGDGLRDAADAYQESAASPEEAERRAVEEFGPVHVVAAEVREELAASAGRYLAGLLVFFGAIQVALGQYVWDTAVAEQDWQPPGPGYSLFSQAVDIMHVALVFAAAAGLFALGRGSRALPSRRVVRIIAVGVVASVVVDVVAGSVLTALAPNDPATWEGSELTFMGALKVLSSVWCAWLACRCLWLTSRRRMRSQDLADDAAELAPVLLPGGQGRHT